MCLGIGRLGLGSARVAACLALCVSGCGTSRVEHALRRLDSADPKERIESLRELLRSSPDAHYPTCITVGVWAVQCDSAPEVRKDVALRVGFRWSLMEDHHKWPYVRACIANLHEASTPEEVDAWDAIVSHCVVANLLTGRDPHTKRIRWRAKSYCEESMRSASSPYVAVTLARIARQLG